MPLLLLSLLYVLLFGTGEEVKLKQADRIDKTISWPHSAVCINGEGFDRWKSCNDEAIGRVVKFKTTFK